MVIDKSIKLIKYVNSTKYCAFVVSKLGLKGNGKQGFV
jgi:hypothetical protein